MDPTLRAIAEGQRGTFTAEQAARLGISYQDLSRLVRARSVHRIRGGEYAVRATWDAAEPWTRLLMRTTVALVHRPNAVAARHAALVVHGLPLHAVDLQRVDLLAAVSRPYRRSGVVTDVAPEGLSPVVVDGLSVVPVPHAIVGTTLASGLIAGLVAADAALHRGLAILEEIRAAGPPKAAGRGERTLEELLRRADGLAESPGETRTRMILQLLDVPVRSQMIVRRRGQVLARVDFLVGDRVVVEFDGLVKYDGADGRRALVAEKQREDALRALGFVVVRLVWSDLDHPDVVLARVRAALRSLAA